MSRANKGYEIRSMVCDWALDIPMGDTTFVLYFNSQNNAELVKAVLEWEDAHPNEAIPYQPTLTPPNEWVSVDERLPKYNIREDGELVSSKILCYCETDKTVHLAVSQKFYIGRMGEIVHPIFRYYDEWGYEVENVSHWMPLPAPPDRRPPEGET